ncbi:hypothetical protein FB451DRAFT_1027155, partial [Mycena latifolia]
DLTGKTVVALGANAGLGLEATKHFASMNPGRLILACRRESRRQTAVESASGSSISSISHPSNADKFEQDGGRLDILVANAAVAGWEYTSTKDEWETSPQVNDLSTPLVAFLLLPRMIQTAREYATFPCIVIVSSGRTTSSPWTKSCARILHLQCDVVLDVFFVRAMNARITPVTPPIVNAVDPGYCYSEQRCKLVAQSSRNLSGGMAVGDVVMEWCFTFPPERGSRQLVWAALAHQDCPDKLRGEFISSSHIQEAADFVLSTQGIKVQNAIWDEMVEILGKVDPRVTANIAKYLSPPA